ncbi:hypothetical protein ALC56_13753 [Trachymyrmex septentrionalis]|uniref:Uncharacterized protein n=1 Tax=Trachymyrmex septentrionalis TaxID=34720 RepID=A0A195EUR3_9HYME|nr:hypothetical protein ALC56_13753 [Trachymyrmex septentrionalis]
MTAYERSGDRGSTRTEQTESGSGGRDSQVAGPVRSSVEPGQALSRRATSGVLSDEFRHIIRIHLAQ